MPRHRLEAYRIPVATIEGRQLRKLTSVRLSLASCEGRLPIASTEDGSLKSQPIRSRNTWTQRSPEMDAVSLLRTLQSSFSLVLTVPAGSPAVPSRSSLLRRSSASRARLAVTFKHAAIMENMESEEVEYPVDMTRSMRSRASWTDSCMRLSCSPRLMAKETSSVRFSRYDISMAWRLRAWVCSKRLTAVNASVQRDSMASV
mmetsp:Transcript_468/g.1423  ORF Transcript_468/g.1423 Transcript_468/m.1423 type:complete len:202 (+) Transcript_468:1461-2066(+)